MRGVCVLKDRNTGRRPVKNLGWILGALLLITMAGCTGHGDTARPAGGGGRRAMTFPVEVAAVEVRPVEYSVNGVGSVEAFEIVAITARVAGVVEKVLFSEGDVVAAAKPLVEIEPDRYRLSVESAEAAAEKAEAQKSEAEAALRRRQQVNAKNPDLVKEEDLEAYRTQVRVATADVVEKKAELEMTKLNLRDAYVRAPVSGIVQTRQIQTGEYVQTGTVMATMVRRDPLLLRFKVPSEEAAALSTGRKATFQVRGEDRIWSAVITHVAAAANEASRMVDVTAHVDDPEKARLRAGAFAQVTVPVGEARPSPVIPQTAVRPSERGFVTFVVTDSTARERIVTLGLRTEDGRVEIKTGLEAGDLLVVRGAEALSDGAKIRISGPGESTGKGLPPAAPAGERKGS